MSSGKNNMFKNMYVCREREIFEYTCIYPKSQSDSKILNTYHPHGVKVIERSCDPIIVLLRESDITKMDSMHKN